MLKKSELPTPNLISNGTSLKGEVKCEGDFRIDGEFDGIINIGGCLVVGSLGKVKGTIKAKSTEIAGKVEGMLQIEEYTLLKSTASLSGDLTTDKLAIENGAIFNCKCEMK